MKRALVVLGAIVGGVALGAYVERFNDVQSGVFERCVNEGELNAKFCEPCAAVAARNPLNWEHAEAPGLTFWCLDEVGPPPINPVTGLPVE